MVKCRRNLAGSWRENVVMVLSSSSGSVVYGPEIKQQQMKRT